MFLKNYFFPTLLLLLAVFFLFRGWQKEEGQSAIEAGPSVSEESAPSQEMGPAETEGLTAAPISETEQDPSAQETFVETGPEPEPESETLDALLDSPEDREVWKECLGEDAPENTNLLEWADNSAEGGRRVHWARTRFRDTAGQEFELAYMEGGEGEPSRLQLFKPTPSGGRGEPLREEILGYDEAVSVASEWIEAGQKLDEEVSVSYNSNEYGEIFLQLKNMAPVSLVVKNGETALSCSLRGTRPGQRCRCGQFGP